MKRLYIYMVGAALTACGHSHDDGLGHHHEHAEGHEMGSEIVLEPEIAEKFGVSTDTIRPGDFYEVIRVTGEVLNTPTSNSVVTAPTAGVVRFSQAMKLGNKVSAGTSLASINAESVSGGDRNKADKAAMEAAKRELERVTPLYEEGIVSLKDYNAAKEAYEIAKSQYSPAAASGSAKAVSNGVITGVLVDNGQYVEAGTPIATISSATKMTLRADVPDKYYYKIGRLNDANIYLPYDDETVSLRQLNGRRISQNGASMREQPGYIPIYYDLDNNGSLIPGSMVYVYLLGDKRENVISVPHAAVVEQQGKHYVFRQIDEECYERLPVTLGSDDGDSYEVTSGLEGGENIVTFGAYAVRLAESSAVAPEGHSHSH